MIHTVRALRKFKKLMRLLRPHCEGLPVSVEMIAIGLLESMWHVGTKDAIRGDIGKFDNDEIAEEIGWHGDADALVQILVDSKWIDEDPEHRLLIHDWEEHAPRFVKGNAKKKGGIIKGGHALKAPPIGQSLEPLGPSLKDGPIGPAPGDTPIKPNQIKPNQIKPNQIKPLEAIASCSEPAPQTSEPEPALLVFPTSGSKKSWPLTQSQLDAWADAYPAVNLLAESNRALSWIDANPTKKKTAKGMKAFLTRWFSKVQNQGGTRGSPGLPASKLRQNVFEAALAKEVECGTT